MRLFVTVILLLLPVAVRVWAADDEAARVIVLANSDDSDSVRLAKYYSEMRGVPKENIIALDLSSAESIGWHEFVRTLFGPLQEELVKRGWIDGIGMDAEDALGRRKYAMSGNRISYLVVCRGVPLRVTGDGHMPEERSVFGANGAFRTPTAAVDSELALLAQSGTPATAFVPNPLFQNDRPSDLDEGQIVKVSRLDGPTFADARRLVDQAIAVEKTGLIGRSYVDIGGPHPQGDRWLEATEKQLEALGFDGDVDRGGGTMREWARFDAPVLYFGWYSGNIDGPFLRPGFVFPPGAIALHIHSFSADTVQSPVKNWVGPLIARGVTATFGNVSEPYLEFTHRPQLILKALARGDSLGEAAAYSIPVYSWQGIVLGDPLYRPFKVSADEQWAHRDRIAPELRPYVVLRHMRELAQQGERTQAIWVGLASQKIDPNLAVALAIADMQKEAGDAQGAQLALKAMLAVRKFSAEEAPLAIMGAQRLKGGGDADSALELWRRVLGVRSLSKDVRIEWLRQGTGVARAAHDVRQAIHWEDELNSLLPPPKPPTPLATAK